jgi:hypothetical protein
VKRRRRTFVLWSLAISHRRATSTCVNGKSVLRSLSWGGSGAHGAFVVICLEKRRRSERPVAREDTARCVAATAMYRPTASGTNIRSRSSG